MPTITVTIDTDELEAPAVQVPRALRAAASVVTTHTQVGLALLLLDGAPIELSDEYAESYIAGKIEVSR